MEIKITQAVKDRRLLDLVTNSMEGPVSCGWAEIVRKEKPVGKENEPMTCEDIVAGGGCIVLTDIEANDKKELRLDLEACQRGLQVMANAEPEHFSDFMAETDDAITADVWLQCAILGECIYG